MAASEALINKLYVYKTCRNSLEIRLAVDLSLTWLALKSFPEFSLKAFFKFMNEMRDINWLFHG